MQTPSTVLLFPLLGCSGFFSLVFNSKLLLGVSCSSLQLVLYQVGNSVFDLSVCLCPSRLLTQFVSICMMILNSSISIALPFHSTKYLLDEFPNEAKISPLAGLTFKWRKEMCKYLKYMSNVRRC